MSQSAPAPTADDIAAIRKFSRFYTRQLGLLAESTHASPYSLSEARVLYELAHGRDITASDLIRELGLDAGYLSRMLKRFEDQGLIRRAPAEDDARRAIITLTRKGETAFGLPDLHAKRVDVADADEFGDILVGVEEGVPEGARTTAGTNESVAGAVCHGSIRLGWHDASSQLLRRAH